MRGSVVEDEHKLEDSGDDLGDAAVGEGEGNDGGHGLVREEAGVDGAEDDGGEAEGGEAEGAGVSGFWRDGWRVDEGGHRWDSWGGA